MTPRRRSSSSRVAELVAALVAGRAGHGRRAPSFEDAFEAELVADLGDLGPGAAEADSGRSDRGDRGGDRRPSRGRSRRR